MLSQSRPAGGAVVDDWLFGAEDCVALGGIFFITSIDDQPTHFDQAIPVILMEVGWTVFVPGGQIRSGSKDTVLNAERIINHINIKPMFTETPKKCENNETLITWKLEEMTNVAF